MRDIRTGVETRNLRAWRPDRVPVESIPGHKATSAATAYINKNAMPTILLLCLSNVFMTYAWYGHLKYLHDRPLWQVILVSWGIAFFEYCLMVPANRLGYGTYTGFQLKVIQEVITLVVFSIFAILVLREKLAWNYVASFVFIMLAVVFAFGFKAPQPMP